MRKIILIVMFAVSGNVIAEWVQYNRGENKSFYYNSSSIRRNGSIVKMWVLIDYKTAKVVDGLAFMSDKSQDEYDCKNELVRPIFISATSGHMGEGKIVSSVNKEAGEFIWRPIVPDSYSEDVWKIACGKK